MCCAPSQTNLNHYLTVFESVFDNNISPKVCTSVKENSLSGRHLCMLASVWMEKHAPATSMDSIHSMNSKNHRQQWFPLSMTHLLLCCSDSQTQALVCFEKKKKIPLNMEALLKPWTATKQFTHKTRSLLPPLSINVKTGTKHHLYCKAAVLGSQWKTTTHPWNELFLPGATWLTLSFLLPQCANNELNVSQPGTIVWT